MLDVAAADGHGLVRHMLGWNALQGHTEHLGIPIHLLWLFLAGQVLSPHVFPRKNTCTRLGKKLVIWGHFWQHQIRFRILLFFSPITHCQVSSILLFNLIMSVLPESLCILWIVCEDKQRPFEGSRSYTRHRSRCSPGQAAVEGTSCDTNASRRQLLCQLYKIKGGEMHTSHPCIKTLTSACSFSLQIFYVLIYVEKWNM